jgi:hypothetical protein
VAALPDGQLMAYWLVDTPAATGAGHSYGLKAAHSSDRGASWHEVFVAGMDNVADYTGFMAFLAGRSGMVAGYLAPAAHTPSAAGAGPDGSHAGHIKTLRVASFDVDGQMASDWELDADVCTCCPLGIATTREGPILVYRDHLPGELRDISIVRLVDGAWTAPVAVHPRRLSVSSCRGGENRHRADGRDRRTGGTRCGADRSDLPRGSWLRSPGMDGQKSVLRYRAAGEVGADPEAHHLGVVRDSGAHAESSAELQRKRLKSICS